MSFLTQRSFGMFCDLDQMAIKYQWLVKREVMIPSYQSIAHWLKSSMTTSCRRLTTENTSKRVDLSSTHALHHSVFLGYIEQFQQTHILFQMSKSDMKMQRYEYLIIQIFSIPVAINPCVTPVHQ